MYITCYKIIHLHTYIHIYIYLIDKIKEQTNYIHLLLLFIVRNRLAGIMINTMILIIIIIIVVNIDKLHICWFRLVPKLTNQIFGLGSLYGIGEKPPITNLRAFSSSKHMA